MSSQPINQIPTEIEFLNQRVAMALLKVGRTTLQRVIKKHQIPVCRLTRRPQYRKSDLVALQERLTSIPMEVKK